MRNYFFQKGQELKTSFGEFLLAYNKLDSHHYALQRVQNCSNNYVFDYYSSFEDNHFLRYYTCWEQQETVTKKIQKQQNIQIKGAKKKSMNLATFLSKKKTQTQYTKNDSVQKSKKDLQNKKQQLIKVKVVYVQLQGFQNVVIPKQTQQIKMSMAVIYLLAQAVHKTQGIWPNIIPVIASDGSLRFVKKGGTRNHELISLFQYVMAERKIEDWSKQMVSIYQMYKINGGDQQLLAEKISYDLTLISSAQYSIFLIIDGKKKAQKAKIIQPQILLLIQSNLKLNLAEFSVSFSYIDQNNRQITLQNYVQDTIILAGQSNNLIIRYLKTFRIR